MKHRMGLWAMASLMAVASTTGLLACASDGDAGAGSEVGNTASTATKLSLNDVSILFPADKPNNWDSFVKASDVGAKGELLPAALVQNATELSRLAFYGKKSTDSLTMPERMQLGHAGIGFESPGDLRVVGVRIDPCFPMMKENDAECTRQIRLVWQTQGFPVGAADTAVHTLHTLTHDEFKALVQSLAALKAAAGGRYDDEPLQVQPLLSSGGMTSDYAQGVLNLVRTYAGVQNMTRLAFFDFLLFRQKWLFGSYDVVGGQSTLRTVDTIGSEYQTLEGFAPAKTTTSSSPPFAAPDNADLFLRNMQSVNDNTKKGFDSLLRIENPTLVSTETTDCVSCHVSTTARAYGDSKLGLASSPSSSRFRSSWNLTNIAEPAMGDTSFHSFGFFEKVTISQRTINESAVVADWCNTKILGL